MSALRQSCAATGLRRAAATTTLRAMSTQKRAAPNDLSSEAISKMKMAELKEELRERELPVTGTRSDLVARLCESCGVKPTRGAPPMKRKKSATSILREQWREELPTLTMGKSGVGEDPLASVAPAPDGCVKVVAWNVNGLRALLRKEGTLEAYVAAEKPDVFCMSETKVSEDWVNTEGKALLPEYHAWWNCAEKKGYSGTAMFSKVKPLRVVKALGAPEHDAEGRLIALEFNELWVVHTYVPNAGQGLKRLDYRTQEWDAALQAFLEEKRKEKPVVWTGDLNVAVENRDIHDPPGNLDKSAGFTLAERNNFREFLERGWVDAFRRQHPDLHQFSYWGFRGNNREKNKGWRLDYVVANEEFADKVVDSFIRYTVVGSDHVPTGAALRTELTGE